MNKEHEGVALHDVQRQRTSYTAWRTVQVELAGNEELLGTSHYSSILWLEGVEVLR
jgi:hypothetical protein